MANPTGRPPYSPSTRTSQRFSQSENAALGGRHVQTRPQANIDKNQSGSCCKSTVKTILAVVAVAALIIGAIGALVYTGHLGVTWQGVGALTQTMGLYGALVGFGTASLAALIALISNCCLKRSGSDGAQPRTVQN